MPSDEKPAGALDEKALAELAKPLDPKRVLKRRGRGRGEFDYLAGHDVKRRANEIFGFGNWAYRLLEIEEVAAVEVENDRGQKGWHIAYRATVEVQVRGCLPFSDVGYGDGVEYGPAAFATARELALKESATDAMKRAFTGWGDQMGLILYAKEEEKRRIQSDEHAEQARPPTVPAADPADVERLRELLREEGVDEARIEKGFTAARAMNRGELHPDYVSEQTAKAEARKAAKTEAAETAPEPAATTT